MIFNSIEFLVFLPVVFILYWFVFNRNRGIQNLFILVVSYVFYGWWDYRFLSLIIFSTLVDYFVGLRLGKEKRVSARKRLLGYSIAVNIGLLGFFKYFNFFLDTFRTSFSLLGVPVNSTALNIVLPVGISFYTFQTLSYTIDVYRQKHEPVKNLVSFAAFVSFFPQLVAGPIERARNLVDQFATERRFRFTDMQFGLIRILWGMFKKVVIADRLAVQVNTVYNSVELFSGQHFLIASFLFGFQIYCDFSGYSDIAIGTARMFGFRLMENFRSPFFSSSLREFWRRWHISLSSWFTDYVYIPLGGSKGRSLTVARNLLLTFMVSGLWHGAAWQYVVWGGLHGMVVVLEFFARQKGRSDSVKRTAMKNVLGTLRTFLFVCLTWMFFRANSFHDTLYMISHLTDFNLSLSMNAGSGNLYLGEPRWRFMAGLLLIVILLSVEFMVNKGWFTERYIIRRKPVFRWGIYITLILSILVFGRFEVDQFIYFQF